MQNKSQGYCRTQMIGAEANSSWRMGTYENCIQQQQAIEPRGYRGSNGPSATRQDLLRRFSLTPHRTDLQLMGRIIRVESNNASLLQLALHFFKSHQHGTAGAREFTWRIVCEPDPKTHSTCVPLSAFSDTGSRYVSVGQRGFLAVDIDKREGVGLLPEVFLEGNARLRHRPPLDILLCMTAASLGLTSLSGGCVGVDGRGVAVFGNPNSGKTTSCYLAARSGLEFQADQVLFLDARRLCVWGDPFPAVFRPATLQFLPELQEQVHHSTYQDSSFYYFDKSPFQPREARPIVPVCSVFLDRGTGCETRLRDVSRAEAVSRLRESVLFEEDEQFDQPILSTLNYLADKPAYELRYDSDPNIAAGFLEKMLR